MGREYTSLLSDPYFEKQLNLFDPNLRLYFNQEVKRWAILEWALDHSGWNVVYVFEDDYGNATPVGEWVFIHLREMRDNNDKLRQNPNAFISDAEYQSNSLFEKEEERLGEEERALIRDHANDFRRAIRAARNLPISDVTAGYRKIERNL